MTSYHLYCLTAPSPERLAAALGEVGGVPASSVDLAAEDVYERDWHAAVLGTLRPMGGHLRLAVEVWMGETARRRPSERAAAGIVARSLGMPVGFPGIEPTPSAYWLALPGGRYTRVRWTDPDEIPADGEPYVVFFSASEHPVAELPDVPVRALPEVIHDHRVPTPVSDRAGVRIGSNAFGAWEALVARMAAGWPPDGWYPAEYYASMLRCRDELPETLDGLAEIDDRYRELTIDDGGVALRARLAGAPLAELDWARPGVLGGGWWWRRIPDPPPWREQPGAAAV